MVRKKRMTSTMENYLEAVLMLQESNQIARVKDIGRLMRVSQPSVHSAVTALLENGYLKHENYGHVELTPSGKKIAEEIYSRHKILTKFLRDILKIDSKVVEEEACGMEHSMSNETLKKLTKFIEFLEMDSDKKQMNCLFRFYQFSNQKATGKAQA